ncbi:MAG TPA: iron donor protein CyaY [Burkholderiaceae bacterium]
MTETEFLRHAEATLEAIEASLEASGLDVECSRAGNVLTIELEDGSRIVVNTQAPTRQIWVAARSGGFHFAADGAAWRDTRSGAELFAVLSRILSEQGGQPVVLRGR